ncbi:MAG: type VI secretion system tip protein VgrG [Polyangiaceae bacterium]|nr:type VI secretion system tip protein VgrG [Polyangiaceae bacterium]
MTDLYAIAIDGLPDGTRVAAFVGREAISECFAFEISLVVPAEDGSFEPDKLVGVDARLGFGDTAVAEQPICVGVVTGAELVQATSSHGFLRVTVRPHLWRLSLARQSRVWTDKKLPDVAKDVLERAEHEGHDLRLDGDYPEHVHICQYHETDLEFLERRLERDGVFYWFEHAEGGEKLVLADSSGGYGTGPTSKFRRPGRGSADESGGQAILRLGVRKELTSKKVKLGDYDYLRPALAVTGEAAAPGGLLGEVSLFGGNLLTPGDAARLAKVRAERLGVEAERYTGSGTVRTLRSGCVFELEEHPLADLNGKYLVTELHHSGVDLGLMRTFGALLDVDASMARGARRARMGAEVEPYHVEFSAVREAQPFRPALRRPVPRVPGLEYGIVDGPADSEYAQIDEHGRYRTRLLFDEADEDPGKNSAWLRMIQPHAGAPEGWHLPLRKGTEVLVAFVAGEPDLPVIVAAVPNAVTPSPVTASNHTHNVFQSGGKNRVQIEDQDGKQYVAVFSPPEKTTLHLGASDGQYAEGHHATVRTDGDIRIHAGANRHITVGGEETEDVGGDVTETYHATQTTHVFGAFTETIDAGATQTINGGETRTVDGGVTEDISGGETRSITANQTETVSANVTRSIGADLSETVGANATFTVGAGQTETTGGARTEDVGGNVTIVTAGPYAYTAVGGATWNTPGGFTLLAPGGVTEVDQEHEAEGGKFLQMYGASTEIAAFVLDVAVLVTEVIGAKVELSGDKHEGGGGKYEAVGSIQHSRARHAGRMALSAITFGFLNWT